MDNRLALAENIYTENINSDLSCPITKDHMHEPMVTADGFSYSKTAIQNWIQHAQRLGNQVASPKTDLPLVNTRLIENLNLKKIVLAWENNEISISGDITHISHIHCPLTGKIMQHPVITVDGHSFEQGAFEKWVRLCEEKNVCVFNPVTNKGLSNTTVIPNQTLKSFIQSWLTACDAIRINNIYTQLTFERLTKEKQATDKLEQLPWWEEERNLWVKARLHTQKYTSLDELKLPNKNTLLKLNNDIKNIKGTMAADEARKLLIESGEISEDLHSQLLYKALESDNEPLVKLLLYFKPRLITVSELDLATKSKNNNNFSTWIFDCLNLESEEIKTTAYDLLVEFGTPESIQKNLNQHYITPNTLKKALDNTKHPEVFSILWNIKNSFSDVDEKENNWRTELASNAIKNEHKQATELIISSWPENVEKSSELIAIALSEANLALTNLLLNYRFILPKNPYALIIKKHMEDMNVLIKNYGLKDFQDTPSFYIFILFGLVAISCSAVIWTALAIEIIPLYMKGKQHFFAVFLLTMFAIGATAFGAYALYGTLFYGFKRRFATSSLENRTYNITLTLLDKINISQTELYQFANVLLANDIQTITFELLFNNYLSTNYNNDNNSDSDSNSDSSHLTDQLTLTENLSTLFLAHCSDSRNKALREKLSVQDWWQEESALWHSAVDYQKTKLLKQGLTLITPEHIKMLKVEVENIAKRSSFIDTKHLRRLLCMGKVISYSNYQDLYHTALKNNYIDILKLLLFYTPIKINLKDINDLYKVLDNNNQHNKHECICILYNFIKTQGSTSEARLLKHLVRNADLKSVKRLLDPKQINLAILTSAIKNTKNSEVFPFVWHKYQELLLLPRENDRFEITIEQQVQLATKALELAHQKAFTLLCQKKETVPQKPIACLLSHHVKLNSVLLTEHNKAEKAYLKEYPTTSLVLCSSLITLSFAAAGYLTKMALASEAYIILTMVVMMFHTSIIFLPTEYLYRAITSLEGKQLNQAKKNLADLTSNCLGILCMLTDLEFIPEDETLELVVEKYNQGQCSEKIYNGIFNLAENKFNDNQAYRYADLPMRLFTQAKNYLTETVTPKLMGK